MRVGTTEQPLARFLPAHPNPPRQLHPPPDAPTFPDWFPTLSPSPCPPKPSWKKWVSASVPLPRSTIPRMWIRSPTTPGAVTARCSRTRLTTPSFKVMESLLRWPPVFRAGRNHPPQPLLIESHIPAKALDFCARDTFSAV